MISLKRALLGAMAAPGTGTALRPFRKGVGTIFMLHRFLDRETGAVGHDPEELRRTLRFLRRRGYEFVELGELFRRLRDAEPPGDLGVAFTLDDGYAEQVRVAGPVFAEFDCPATVFVTTGFLDRKLWFWWDRIEYVFDRASGGGVTVKLGSDEVSYRWDHPEDRARACGDFTARCKLVPDQEKHAAIAGLAERANVAIPAEAPARYAPMTWAELRAWEQRGITFGPHTVTHPILAQVTAEQSRDELAGSWTRLRAEARRPAPVFCYPNGQPGDFGPREFSTLETLGLAGAVVGSPGYADAAGFRTRADGPFAVRRFSYPGDYRLAAKYASGVERLLHGTGGP
jgi:peptidoglycan/xylan/chitin deacetylase (PgdA/CDA1 family)